MLLLVFVTTCCAVVDIVVLGATGSGVGAAVAAGRLGANVVLLERHSHVGGMLAGGIGFDDVYNLKSFSSKGLYMEFASRVLDYYTKTYGAGSKQVELCKDGHHHEPSVAEKILLNMLDSAGVSVVTGTTFVGVQKSGSSVSLVEVEKNGEKQTVVAKVFIDASYEGDLLAAAGMPYSLGREGRGDFNELTAGRAFVDSSTHQFLRGSTGGGDGRVPAMTFRVCFSDIPSEAVPLLQPPRGYNRSMYLGYVDDYNAGRMSSVFNAFSGPRALPNNKFDMNMNPRPLGFVFAGPAKDEYTEANWTRRDAIQQTLEDITMGLLWFLQHDAAVPLKDRQRALGFNLSKSEFVDHGHFPWQLYIRESRRLRGEYVVSEHDLVPQDPEGRPPLHSDSVRSATYPIDSFPCSEERPAKEQQSGTTPLEGYISMYSAMTAPAQLPLRSLVSSHLDNVVVSAAISATHVAFSSVRLEPTWMELGVAAAAVAHASLQLNTPVHAVPAGYVQRLLVDRLGQTITFYSDLNASDPSFPAFQYLGAKGLVPSFEADSDGALLRSTAASWLNVTLVALEDQTPLSASNNLQWKDFHSGMDGFDSALALAIRGIVTPFPSPDTLFHPNEPITCSSLAAWVQHAARNSTAPRNTCSGDDRITRGGACVMLYTNLV